ncbi:hypothetical protein KKB17_00040, partial [bacterium]|nr:hypothetical protein [bacterium]
MFKRILNTWVISLLLIVMVLGIFSLNIGAEEKVKLVYMTAGDVNMLALGQHVIGPQFNEKYPNVSV